MSAVGHRLAFSRRNLNQELFKLQDGRAPEVILASTFNEQDASFSPDGSKVAFASDRTSEREGNQIWIASAVDGSNRRSATTGAHRPEGSPRWSPDGRRLAYDGLGDDGQRHIYVVDEAGGQVHAIAGKAGVNDQLPTWSRDGKWIYFESGRTGQREVWRAPVAGGDAQQVTTTGGGAPFESWDGRTLYFMRPTQGGRMLFAMPAAGGSERALHITTPFWNFVPTAHGLYYVSMRVGDKPPYTYEVRVHDDASGKERTLYSVRLASVSPGLSVLPDGKTVLIAGVAEISQDLLRIENFR
jgi:dipeptidyl aminopeptidase/acylaminoacyl peptidase